MVEDDERRCSCGRSSPPPSPMLYLGQVAERGVALFDEVPGQDLHLLEERVFQDAPCNRF
jgi:hypothetical protein